MKNVGLRKLVSWTELKVAIALLCIASLAIGCYMAPSRSDIERDREKQARDSIEAIKPPTYLTFTEAFTLEDCIKIGLENNLEVRVAEFNRQIADRETLSAKLKMLPGLNAGVGWEKRDKLKKSDVYDWEADEDRRDTTVGELKDSMKADLTLNFNILDFLIAYARSDSAELKEQILERREKRQKQQLALDIINAYWKAAAMEDALDFVHEVEREMITAKKKIDSQVTAGTMDKMDATDIELRLKELELTIRQLQSSLSSSRLELSQLMGFNQNVQFTLARPPIKPIVAALPHTKELDIDSLEEYALLHRPELFESDIQVHLKKSERQAAFLTMFPGLNLFAATHYDDNRLLLSNAWNSVGAGIGWQLLDLPSRWARVKGHDEAIQMAETERLMMTVGVITQVHIALLDYSIKVDRFRLLEETYDLAKNLHDMAKEKAGVGRLTEMAVTERQLEKMAAKLRRDEAVVDMLVSHKRLCVSIGIDPLECGKNITQAGSGDGYEFSASKAVVKTGPGEKKWRCKECGYVHTGPRPPEVCPICGSTVFEEIPFVEETASRAIDDEDIEGWGADREYVPVGGASRGAPTPGWAGDATDRFLWKVQLGAFRDQTGPNKRLAQIRNLDLRLMDNRDTQVTATRVHGAMYNRVRVIGLTERDARGLVGDLKANGMEFWLLPPGSAHW